MHLKLPSARQWFFGAATLIACGAAVTIAVGTLRYDEHGAQAADVPARPAVYVSTPIVVSSTPAIVIERGVFHPEDSSRFLRAFDRSPAQAQAHVARLGLAAFKGEKVVLAAPVIRIAVNETAKAALSGSLSQAVARSLMQALEQFPFEQLSLRDATIVLNGGSKSVELKDFEAEIAHSARQSETNATGAFKFNGQRLKFTARLAAPGEPKAGEEANGADGALQFTVDGGLLSASFSGTSRYVNGMTLAGKAKVAVQSVKLASRWLGHSIVAGAGFRNFSAEGNATWSGGATVGFENARFAMDGNTAIGTLNLNLAGATPAVEGTLAFGSFDLKPYFDNGSGGLPYLRKAQDDEPVDLKFRLLSQVDADLRVSATKVHSPIGNFGKSAVTVSVKGGRMLADIAELEMLAVGGSAQAQVVADMTGAVPQFSAEGQLTGFNARDLLQALNAPTMLQGRARANFAIAGQGQNPNALLKDLSGTLNVSMNEGGRVKLDINRMLTNAQKGPLTSWVGLKSYDTAFDDLEAWLTVAKGKLIAKHVESKIGDMVLSVLGNADLVNKSLDVQLQSQSRAAVSTPITISNSLNSPYGNVGTERPLLLTGSMSEPLIKFGPALSQQDLEGLLDVATPLPSLDGAPARP